MSNSNAFGFIVIAVILALVATVFIYAPPEPIVADFDDCAAAGYPVMESYPEQCRTPDGRTFVREIPQTASTSNDGLGLQANGCAVAGCSGTLCVSADEAGDIVTTCEYRAEYACYREASCEPQADGMCGWTQTAALRACLADPPPLE